MAQEIDDGPAALFRLWPSYEPTPLVELPLLAERTGTARVFVKDESRRPLGSFKALGGMYAGLRALARAAGVAGIEALVTAKDENRALPRLICASDGNHGLAIAAGAELAGAAARVYLHRHVPESRAKRIADRGAEIVWVDGTYDDAVDEAERAARRGEGLLIADTSKDENDPVVADVMAGYGLLAQEIVEQLQIRRNPPPTHLFVQAGVGGLAAAVVHGLATGGISTCRTIVVEPERAACAGAALRSGRIVRLPGNLQTTAEMLSCGEASAAAMAILRRHQVDAMSVNEDALDDSPKTLVMCGGPQTTPSGAAGLAGFLAAAADATRRHRFGIDDLSRVLLIVTEGTIHDTAVLRNSMNQTDAAY